jgi:internalin A
MSTLQEFGMRDEGKSVSRSWHRFMRLSVRGLIVLVLVIGAGLGWLVHTARIQREAVAALDNVGCHISYDWNWQNGMYVPGGPPWAPKWLVELIGVDYFGHVTRVMISDRSKASDATLEPIGRLIGLKQLFLFESSVGDAGLIRLKGLSNLATLDLSGTRVTDAGLTHLSGLDKLTRLELRGFHVTEAGLTHVRELKGLTHLDLGFNAVTDTGLAQLKVLSNLSTLDLRWTKVSDAGLVHLKELSSLSSVNLHKTHVTDAGISELTQALPNLKIIR